MFDCPKWFGDTSDDVKIERSCCKDFTEMSRGLVTRYHDTKDTVGIFCQPCSRKAKWGTKTGDDAIIDLHCN
jgi:hypothetical protein